MLMASFGLAEIMPETLAGSKCHGIALDAVRGVQAEGGLTDSVELVYGSTDHGDSDERVNNPAPSLREASR